MRTADVLARAARKEAEDAVNLIAGEITEVQTSEDAHNLFVLATDLEQQFARLATLAAERAEWLIKVEGKR